MTAAKAAPPHLPGASACREPASLVYCFQLVATELAQTSTGAFQPCETERGAGGGRGGGAKRGEREARGAHLHAPASR